MYFYIEVWTLSGQKIAGWAQGDQILERLTSLKVTFVTGRVLKVPNHNLAYTIAKPETSPHLDEKLLQALGEFKDSSSSVV